VFNIEFMKDYKYMKTDPLDIQAGLFIRKLL